MIGPMCRSKFHSSGDLPSSHPLPGNLVLQSYWLTEVAFTEL